MDLTYEETMRRIDDREMEYAKKGLKRTFCRVIKYPYHVHLYYGESQIIVVPLTTAIGWFSVEMAWYCQITDLQNAKLIGETIFEAFEHIKNSPVDARTAQERCDDSFMKHAVSYKSYTAFNRNYLLCGVILHEDGRIVVSQTRKLDNNKGYGGDDNTLIHLNNSPSVEDIGNAVIKSFVEMKSFYENYKSVKPEIPRFEFQTLSDMKISFKIPQGDGYTDEEDYSSSEIYQGYSYSKSEDDDEPVGHIYFSIAAELNYDLSSENVLNVFEEKYGAATQYEYIECEHSIFKYRAEIIGKNIHRILYLKQIDENELLSCELTINTKKSGKRLDIKLTKDFESLIKTCKTDA